jgi:hypothetical protein
MHHLKTLETLHKAPNTQKKNTNRFQLLLVTSLTLNLLFVAVFNTLFG